MPRSSIRLLQLVVVLIGIGALTFMLWEPHIEGRNQQATLFEIYFKDPFLAYAYVASSAFFVALYQAFQVLGHAGQNRLFSPKVVNAFRTIKYCAIASVGFVAGSVVFMPLGDPDDRPQGIVMRLVVTVAWIVVGVAAAKCERAFRNATPWQAR